MRAARAVGLFGGCFDPIHNGHAAIAAAAAALPVEKVLLVVNGQPGHRRPPATEYGHRVAMAGMVADSADGCVEVSELEKPGRPRYAIDTVSEIRRQGMRPVLIVGADAFAHLPAWHRWQDLLAVASVAVVARTGFSTTALHPRLEELIVPDSAGLAEPSCIWRWSLPVPDCSSSRIRAQLAAGRRQRAGKCLDDRVFEYIGEHGLYAAAAGG